MQPAAVFQLPARPDQAVCVTMTTEVGTNGATTLSRVDFSENVGHVMVTFSGMFTTACCLVVGLALGLGLRLGLDVVSGWLVVMRQLQSVRHSATRFVLKSLVSSLVLQWLDYGNATLAGIPSYLI